MKMTRLIHFLGALLILSTLSSELKAQRNKGEAVLTGGLGLSIWNIIAGALNTGDSLIAKSTPTFSLMYDYGITSRFSIGGAVGYNSFSFTNPYYSYVNSSGAIVYESISVKYSSVNVGLRPMYHWGKSEIFEWMAGMRLGYSFWTAEVITTDPYYKDEYFRRDMYSAQVLFGSRAYMSEFLAVTFEVGIGAPYFANLGLSLKL